VLLLAALAVAAARVRRRDGLGVPRLGY